MQERANSLGGHAQHAGRRLALQVADLTCKMARKGMTPSEIGVALRDANGVPSVAAITGTKVLRILRAAGLAAAIPEDLYHLVKKAVQVRKHLERNRKDKVPRGGGWGGGAPRHMRMQCLRLRSLPASPTCDSCALQRTCTARTRL